MTDGVVGELGWAVLCDAHALAQDTRQQVSTDGGLTCFASALVSPDDTETDVVSLPTESMLISVSMLLSPLAEKGFDPLLWGQCV